MIFKKKKYINYKNKFKYKKLSLKYNLKSKSWFKLFEINKKYKIIKKNDNIINLGSYPGGWTKLILNKIKLKGKIFCCDIIKNKKKNNIKFIKGNICKKKIFNLILKKTKKYKIKNIISDISHNITGIKEIDNPKNKKIIKTIINLCIKKLIYNGNLIIKVFLGENFSKYFKKIKKMFNFIKTFKPQSSNNFSKEIYIIAKKYKKKIKN